jgi:hypothetical protein
MQLLAVCVSQIALLLPTVAGQIISSGDDDSDGFHFDVPPLEDANFAIYAILVPATLIQLGLAASFLFRAHSPYLIPGIATIAALLFLLISYALDFAVVVEEFTVDNFRDKNTPNQAYLNLSTT